MPDPNEAREEAWRAWAGVDSTHAVAHTTWQAAWDARGRYDEQRIAVLEAALRRYMWIRMVTSQQDR